MDVKTRVAAATVSGALTIAGFALFRLLEISTQRAILEQIRIPSTLFSVVGVNTAALVTLVISKVVVFVLPFVPLTLALAALAVYRLVAGEDRRLGPIVVGAGSAVGLVIVGVSFTGVFLALGLVLAAAFMPGAAAQAYQQQTRWHNYKSVSHAAGRGILILGVFLAIGTFFSVVTNIQFYTEQSLNEIRQGVEPFAVGQLTDDQIVATLPPSVKKKFDALSPAKQKEFIAEYRELLKEAPFVQPQTSSAITQLVTTYLYATPLVVFGVLEFLRSVVLVHIAGLAAVPVMRRRERLGLIKPKKTM